MQTKMKKITKNFIEKIDYMFKTKYEIDNPLELDTLSRAYSYEYVEMREYVKDYGEYFIGNFLSDCQYEKYYNQLYEPLIVIIENDPDVWEYNKYLVLKRKLYKYFWRDLIFKADIVSSSHKLIENENEIGLSWYNFPEFDDKESGELNKILIKNDYIGNGQLIKIAKYYYYIDYL